MRLLPTGRWRASYRTPGHGWRTESRTFSTRLEAKRWLESVENHVLTGRRIRRTHDQGWCPTPAQATELADAIEPRLRLAVQLAAHGGLRLGEILALQPSNRRGHTALVITHTVSVHPTSAGSQPMAAKWPRVVDMPRQLRNEWNRHVELYASARWLFLTADGDRMRPHHAEDALAQACGDVGFPRLRFHSLRYAGPGDKDGVR